MVEQNGALGYFHKVVKRALLTRDPIGTTIRELSKFTDSVTFSSDIESIGKRVYGNRELTQPEWNSFESFIQMASEVMGDTLIKSHIQDIAILSARLYRARMTYGSIIWNVTYKDRLVLTIKDHYNAVIDQTVMMGVWKLIKNVPSTTQMYLAQRPCKIRELISQYASVLKHSPEHMLFLDPIALTIKSTKEAEYV